MKLLIEAAAKRWERDHNARVWLAWHIAALSRVKKIPNIKRMMLNSTAKPRQTWRQQLEIFSEWAVRRNAMLARQEELGHGG